MSTDTLMGVFFFYLQRKVIWIMNYKYELQIKTCFGREKKGLDLQFTFSQSLSVPIEPEA